MFQRADGVSISMETDQVAAGSQIPASALPFDVVVARLNLANEAVRAGAALLPACERQRAARLRFERDRRRFIASRALLRALLAQRLAIPPEQIALVYGKYGKPALARHQLQFNLSHSGDYTAYAFACDCEIGIDIEEVRSIPEADAIAARIFSRSEQDAYAALPADARSLGFFGCWTRKEAVVKALGEGLRMPLDQFDVSLAPGEPARLLRIGTMTGEQAGWRLDCLRPVPGIIGAVARKRRGLH